jgi:hypothetical protein
MSIPSILETRSLALPIVNPSEWPLVDEETRRLLRPANGVYTVQQAEIMEKIARGRWFLLQNRGPKGWAWRCGRCKRIHSHFTLHCRPLPMNGLTHVVGLLKERLSADLIFSAVEMGVIEPITIRQAGRYYRDLRSLGYPADLLMGGDPRKLAQYSPEQVRLLVG